MPDSGPVVRAFPGAKQYILTTGAFPIFITVTRDSTVLANTTNTVEIRFSKEGNYRCVAIDNYGSSMKADFRVTFLGKYDVSKIFLSYFYRISRNINGFNYF